MSEKTAVSDSDYLIYMVQNLVDYPEAVTVDRATDEKGVLLTLHVHAEDMGKVIGKAGATSQALRLIMRGKGRRGGAIVSVKIAEPSGVSADTDM